MVALIGALYTFAQFLVRESTLQFLEEFLLIIFLCFVVAHATLLFPARRARAKSRIRIMLHSSPKLSLFLLLLAGVPCLISTQHVQIRCMATLHAIRIFSTIASIREHNRFVGIGKERVCNCLLKACNESLA